MKLYRYCSILDYSNKDKAENQSSELKLKNHFIEQLKESKINFSHPASFNDPLECTIPIQIDDYEKYKEKYLQYVEHTLAEREIFKSENTSRSKRIYETIEFGMPLENCLVACFTKKEDEQLMWSHYADYHKGICLCYEFPDATDEWNKKIKWNNAISKDMDNCGMEWIGASVRYEAERPALIVTDSSLPITKWTFKNSYITKDAILSKPLCWSYENEWRLVLHLPLGCGRAFSPDIRISDYYVTIPREWLKGITFGLRLDEKYCSEIIDCVNSSGYKNVLFKKAKLVHGRFEISSEEYVL